MNNAQSGIYFPDPGDSYESGSREPIPKNKNFQKGKTIKHYKLTVFAAAILCFSLTARAAANIECNRKCLSGFMTNYLEALLAHDASKLPVTKNVKYTENGEQVSMAWMDCKAQFDTGFSVIVTDIRERRFIADPVTGLSFAMGYFDHDGAVNKSLTQPYSFIIGEIFKIMDGKIRQIEAVLMTVPYGMESGW